MNLTYWFTVSDVLAKVIDNAREIYDVFNIADSMAALCDRRQDVFGTVYSTRTIGTHLPSDHSKQTKIPTYHQNTKMTIQLYHFCEH